MKDVIEKIGVLSLRDGDTVIIKVPINLTPESKHKIGSIFLDHIKRTHGGDVHVLVIDDGIGINILRGDTGICSEEIEKLVSW